MDCSDYDPGVIIILGPPADIHAILGLPAVRAIHIPPGINPPSVPLQQGKTSNMFGRWVFFSAAMPDRDSLFRLHSMHNGCLIIAFLAYL